MSYATQIPEAIPVSNFESPSNKREKRRKMARIGLLSALALGGAALAFTKREDIMNYVQEALPNAEAAAGEVSAEAGQIAFDLEQLDGFLQLPDGIVFGPEMEVVLSDVPADIQSLFTDLQYYTYLTEEGYIVFDMSAIDSNAVNIGGIMEYEGAPIADLAVVNGAESEYVGIFQDGQLTIRHISSFAP